jgi:hypothetical protein
MATAAAGIQQFEIGRVFGRTFGAISRNLPLFLGLGALLVGLPTLITQFIFPQPSLSEALAGRGASGTSFLSSLIVFAGMYVLQATLVRATIEDLNDRRAEFGDCLSTGIRAVLPILAITVLTSLGAGLGMILLVVPGIILWLGWSVAVPVEVEERSGIFGSMRRSRELTRGSKWKILGLILLMFVPVMVLQIVLLVALGVLGPSAVTIGSALLSTVTSTIFMAALASAYVELRMIKDGSSEESLASIFA